MKAAGKFDFRAAFVVVGARHGSVLAGTPAASSATMRVRGSIGVALSVNRQRNADPTAQRRSGPQGAAAG